MLKDSLCDYNFRDLLRWFTARWANRAISQFLIYIFSTAVPRIFALKVNIIYHVSLLVFLFFCLA